MAAKNDILRDKDGNQIFPATMAEQVSYDGKMNVKQAIKRGAVRNKVAPTVASMTDKEQIYVYTGTEEGYTFGNWYYWDGTAWTSGGAYNAIEVNTDGTLTEEGAPADAKATGDKLIELKDDLYSMSDFALKSANEFGNEWTEGGYINPSTGAIVPTDSFKYTDFYPIRSGTHRTLYIKSATTISGTIIFYDSSKNILGNISATVGDSPIADNVAYIRLYVSASYTGTLYISTVQPLGAIDYNYAVGRDLQYDGLPLELMKEVITSANKFSNYWITGGYIDTSNNIVSAPNWKYTPKYIELPKGVGRTLHIARSTTEESVFVVRYDANYNRIDTKSTGTAVDSYEIEDSVVFLRCYAKTAFTGNLYISTSAPSDTVDYSYSTEMMVKASKIEQELQNSSEQSLTVVNFGDSIIGNSQGTSGDLASVSSLIAKIMKCDVVNGGFGGCRMGAHESGWDAFSMYRVADAITTGDWTLQDAAWADHESLNLPGYFGTTIETLKAIDFSKVDIITIEYGTNDWASGVVLTPSDADLFDTDTFGGALRYSLKTILDEYPHMKIAVQNPTPRFKMSGSTIVETSDTAQNSRGNTLVDLINEENSVCREYKVPTIDAYYKSLINASTHDVYMYSATEDVHLGLNGRKRLAEIVAKYLMYEM